MPFQSKAQNDACFAARARGEKGWDCEEWAAKTDYSSLPKKKGKTKKLAVDRIVNLGSTKLANSLNDIFRDIELPEDQIRQIARDARKMSAPLRMRKFSPSSFLVPLGQLAAMAYWNASKRYSKGEPAIGSFNSLRGNNVANSHSSTLLRSAMDILSQGLDKTLPKTATDLLPGADLSGKKQEQYAKEVRVKFASVAAITLNNLANEVPFEERSEYYLISSALSAGYSLDGAIKQAYGEDIPQEKLASVKRLIVQKTAAAVKTASEIRGRMEKLATQKRARAALRRILRSRPGLVVNAVKAVGGR